MELFHSQIFIIFVCIISIYLIIYITSKIECRLYKISKFDIKNSKNSSKISIVFLSDFHNKSFKNVDDIFKKIISLKPDVILLGGDFVNFSSFHSAAKNPTFDNAIYFLEFLSQNIDKFVKNNNSKNIPIYFVLGNHESRLHKRLPGFYNMFIERIEKLGIKILEGENVKISDGISLTGFSVYDGYYTNIFGKKANKPHIFEELDKKCKKVDDKMFNIMVFHKPDYADDFWEYGYDLVLSGHNHGGLIRFPYIGSFFSPDLKFLPKYSYGHYESNNRHLIVSNGIGEHFIKIRVNNRPEICHININ